MTQIVVPNKLKDPRLALGPVVTRGDFECVFLGDGGSGFDIRVFLSSGFMHISVWADEPWFEGALFNIPKGFALKQAPKVVYRTYEHPSYTADVIAHDVAVYAYFENSSGKKMVMMAVVRKYESKISALEDNTHVDVFSVKFDTDKPFEFEPMPLERVRELHHGATHHWFQCNQKLLNPEGIAVRALTDMYAVGRLYGREYTAAAVAAVDESEGKRVKSE